MPSIKANWMVPYSFFCHESVIQYGINVIFSKTISSNIAFMVVLFQIFFKLIVILMKYISKSFHSNGFTMCNVIYFYFLKITFNSMSKVSKFNDLRMFFSVGSWKRFHFITTDWYINSSKSAKSIAFKSRNCSQYDYHILNRV
jgi:hypothetical protein